MSDELTEHDVAVVVVVRAPGVDAGDATDRVEAFVRRNLPRGAEEPHSGLPLDILAVRSVQSAFQNGYLGTYVTGYAAHMRGLPPINEQED